VLPGATQRDIGPAIEQASGKRSGVDFGLCYSPEFIAIGDVINGLLHPDYFLIGEIDDRSGAMLEQVYRATGDTDIPIQRMSIANAELTKIAVNSFVTMKISFANTICRVCSRLEAGDAHVVTRALGMDRRIGGRYLSPGATFGGPCFPRDNRAFEWFARSVHEDAPIARATDDVNGQQVDFLVERLLAAAPDANVVGILGLSYKPKTNLMERALGVELSRSLIGRGLTVRAYDPWVHRQGTTEDVDGLELASSVQECIAGADIAVLATIHDEFQSLTPADLDIDDRSVPLLDVWGFLDQQAFGGYEGYVVPGRGPTGEVCAGSP
jgi:UDPglucose 6-dehydrogenase